MFRNSSVKSFFPSCCWISHSSFTILLTVSTAISCNFCHMIDSKSALGRGMSGEEKSNLKQELNSLNMEDISSFMESLPPDFFRILRTE
jgi:hypothetical protein